MKNDIASYRRIRRAIGYLGISLPIILVIMSLIPFFKTPVQSSISSYYYSNLREIFTGTLCAVGLFLIRYTGFKSSAFWKNDNLLTNIAGYLAFGVAFFPVNPDNWAEKVYTLVPLNIKLIGYMHYGFASLFFLVLAIISINVFTIGQKADDKIRKSLINENNIYKGSGYLMLFFIGLIPVFSYLRLFSSSTLLLEALALILFGISWLVKGRALGDSGKIGEKVYSEAE
ncbi:MAG: hypothetical protein R6W78_18475 [Bacteroidales bacterium]